MKWLLLPFYELPKHSGFGVKWSTKWSKFSEKERGKIWKQTEKQRSILISSFLCAFLHFDSKYAVLLRTLQTIPGWKNCWADWKTIQTFQERKQNLRWVNQIESLENQHRITGFCSKEAHSQTWILSHKLNIFPKIVAPETVPGWCPLTCASEEAWRLCWVLTTVENSVNLLTKLLGVGEERTSDKTEITSLFQKIATEQWMISWI